MLHANGLVVPILSLGLAFSGGELCVSICLQWRWDLLYVSVCLKWRRALCQHLRSVAFSSMWALTKRSHNLRKFPQIYAVFMGVVLVIMRILCILFKSLLLSHSQPPSPYRNKDMEISCESAGVELCVSICFKWRWALWEYLPSVALRSVWAFALSGGVQLCVSICLKWHSALCEHSLLWGMCLARHA